MKKSGRPDHGLELLLDLDGVKFELERGFWVKFEVRQLTRAREIPHGIRYSLTLHDRTNRRVLGYDNAHAVMTRHRKRKTSIRDHRHYGQLVEIYHYRTADKLLEDFYIDVNLILNKERDQGI